VQRDACILSRTFSRLLACLLAVNIFAESERVTVVYTSEAEPYTQALDALRASLSSTTSSMTSNTTSNTTLTAVDLHSPRAERELASALGSGSNRLIITIGKDALDRVNSLNATAPLVATMIMRSEQERVHKIAAAIHLDIAVSDIVAELKPMFPHKTRVAIIRNPLQPGQVDNSVVARCRQQGFTVQVIDSTNPEELLRAVHSLNGQVDFIVCLPDNSLYNSSTVKPLILASLESHLLIVGFSASFVRAGAGVGVFPDFRDIGAQAGEIVQKQLAGQAVAAEQGPRKVIVAVNQRVIRLLGLECRPRRAGEVMTFR
jgi:putative tryptophan/tyrosine transport system substrate-binding protein